MLPTTITTLIVPDDFLTIQEALDFIGDGGTVYVRAAATAYEVTNLHWEDKHVSLKTPLGNPATLTLGQQGEGEGQTSVIRLEWSGIDNTDLIYGFVIEDCVVEECYSDQDTGPAMFLANGASPTISNCTISGNWMQNLYGVSNTGGAIEIRGCNDQQNAPLFQSCVFEDNIATNGCGGAVHLDGIAEFQNCQFISNESAYDLGRPSEECSGGAVSITNSFYNSTETDGVISFSNCSFSGNFASDCGSDIFIEDLSPLSGSHQVTSKIRITDCDFDSSGSSSSGAGIYLFHNDDGSNDYKEGLIEISGCTFRNYSNKAVYFNDYAGRTSFTYTYNAAADCGTNGFYLRYHGIAPVDPDYLTFDHNTFKDIDGDAVVFYQGADYIVSNCAFDNVSGYSINWGSYESGNPTWATSSLTIDYCLFDDPIDDALDDDEGNVDHPLSTNNVQFSTDPQLDANFTPIWTSTTRSPLSTLAIPTRTAPTGTTKAGERTPTAPARTLARYRPRRTKVRSRPSNTTCSIPTNGCVSQLSICARRVTT